MGIKIIMMDACYGILLLSLSPLLSTSNVVTTNIPLCNIAIVTPLLSNIITPVTPLLCDVVTPVTCVTG